MAQKKKKIGILTGGGDCPGLNAVIRGITKAAVARHDVEVVGFMDGFLGMVERRYCDLTANNISGILTRGGTILGSTNKADPFACPQIVNENKVNEKISLVDQSDECVSLYNELNLDALICLGGDGTQSIAGKLARKGIRVIGVPKTIDKDVVGTDETFGFDSARFFVTEAIDRLHTTAESHKRVMVIEVMGRNAGWLALESGIAGGGDIILIPEIPYSIDSIIDAMKVRHECGKQFSIVVVSEGACAKGAEQIIQEDASCTGGQVRLGGIGNKVARAIEKQSGIECRVAVLGHLQRGGAPTPYDRLLATRFAVHAMQMVAEKQFDRVVALQSGHMGSVPIETVVGKQRQVPLDSELIEVAESVGVSFGRV